MISRRRFLAITSCAITTGSSAMAAKWTGVALGANASITLYGDPHRAQIALRTAKDTLSRLQGMFSLYDPKSVISVLNRTGRVEMPPEFSALIKDVGHAFLHSDGLFDPTIQPLWSTLLNGQDTQTADALSLVGWQNVDTKNQTITFLKRNMAISLNGIAQGFVTDLVSNVLASHGFVDTIVNIGEYAVGGRSAHLGIADAQGEILASKHIRNGAIATSSPSALMLRSDAGHILHPVLGTVNSIWDTVSVRAKTARFADAYSTALTLTTDTALARRLLATGEIQGVFMKTTNGQVFDI
jgi:thiamine biosynthesis lipoprotein